MEQRLKASIDTAVAVKAVKPKDVACVTVDTTVQDKAIAHPGDSPCGQACRDSTQSDL